MISRVIGTQVLRNVVTKYKQLLMLHISHIFNNNKENDDTVKCYMAFESVISQCFVFN